jgi:DNA-binding IclR family transcriptional regulator
VLTVVEFLGAGEIEEWRSLREVAAGAGMPESACYRILETLTARSWVDKSPKGYRFGSLHLLGMLIYAQQYWLKKFENLGVKQ